MTDAGRAGPAIMVVAGEPSGDLHASGVLRALRQLAPDCRLFGMGGPHMIAAGLEAIVEATDTAVIGVSEAVRRLPRLRRALRDLAGALEARRPAVLVLVDFPDFNLRLAGVARRLGIPVAYFIPPQIWAWRRGRLAAIRERVSLVLAILPFEPALYRDAGIPAVFVGHPAVEMLAGAPDRAAARAQLGLSAEATVVGLLPGSRRQEIEHMTPLMREAAVKVARERPGTRFVLALASSIEPSAVTAHLAREPEIRVVTGATPAVMRAADVLAVASGTATLEAALLGVPMVVCYRVSLITELVGRLALRVPWISLVNIVLGRGVVPELYRRGEVTADRLAAEVERLLEPEAAVAQREAFGELATLVGGSGFGERAARGVLELAGGAAATPRLSGALAGR